MQTFESKFMKMLILLLILFDPCAAQTTNAPPREESIKQLSEIFDNPKLTMDDRQKAEKLALEMLNEDTEAFTVDDARLMLLKHKITQLGGRPIIPTLSIGTKISFTTLDGKSFSNAEIKDISLDSFTVVTSDGGAKIMMENVDRSLQDKLGYDPALLPEAPSTSSSTNTSEPPPQPVPSSVTAAVETPPTLTMSGKPLQEGLNIISADAKIMRQSGNYDYIAWKVVLYNQSDNELSNVSMRLSFRDKDDFEVDSDRDTADKIKARASVTLTGQTMMKPEEWAKVEGYAVKTD